MMTRTDTRPRSPATTVPQEQRYRVWIRGTYAGTVDAGNDREARTEAARIFMAAREDVCVLPPY